MNRSPRDDFPDHNEKFQTSDFDASSPGSSHHATRGLERDLLGYVLGALDDEETRQIEELIRQRPDLEDELQLIRKSIAPLEQIITDHNPPTGLARRTCEAVAAYRSANQDPQEYHQNAFARPVQMSGSSHELNLRGSSISLRDLIAIVACVLVLASIAIPVINNNRFYSQVVQCQNNLREAGMALLRYADNHGGSFVSIPTEGNLSVAGVYAPTLLEEGLIDDDSRFFCVSRNVEVNRNRNIPSIDEINQAEGRELIGLQRQMAGDFGYSMGYVDDNRYVTPQNQGRSFVLLLADMPSPNLPGRASANHGGYGQNCVFEDGRVQFVGDNWVAGDAIYENDLGQVAPGAHELDNVVGPSHARLPN